MLWVATANGFVRFDRERESYTIYDERDGLPDSSVHGILEDRHGNLWVSTLGGIIPVQPAHENVHQLPRYRRPGRKRLRGLSGRLRNPARGQMFFGSKSGLTSFWPDQIVETPYIPPVVLTQFSLRNVPVAPGPGPSSQSPSRRRRP